MAKVMKERNMQHLTVANKIGKGAVKTGTYVFLLLMALIVM